MAGTTSEEDRKNTANDDGEELPSSMPKLLDGVDEYDNQ